MNRPYSLRIHILIPSLFLVVEKEVSTLHLSLPRRSFYHFCNLLLLPEVALSPTSSTCDSLGSCLILAFLHSWSKCLTLSNTFLLFSVTCCHKVRFLLFHMLHKVVGNSFACVVAACSKTWKMISDTSSDLFNNGSIKCHNLVGRHTSTIVQQWKKYYRLWIYICGCPFSS